MTPTKSALEALNRAKWCGFETLGYEAIEPNNCDHYDGGARNSYGEVCLDCRRPIRQERSSFSHEDINTIKQAITANTWQTIETAPRNMSDILVFDGNSVWIAYYDTDYNEFLKRDVIEDNIPSASHWMPLPPKPEQPPC